MKLNLQWVTDVIGDDFRKWKDGDVILLECQTGTGKTYFIKNTLIPNMLSYRWRFLFVCNRINLKRQIKRDLLSIHKKEIPNSLEELDKITTILGTTITSYQAIQEAILNHHYYENEIGPFKKSMYYDFIILDECHYVFADSGFNNKTRLAFEEFIYGYHPSSIKIFITATANEVITPILNYLEKMKPLAEKYFLGGRELELHRYSTGIDYSYVNPKYFRKTDDIITTIKNDSSDDKWIVFVSSIEDGQNIEEQLGVDSVFIKAGTRHTELDSIINESKFNRKVLVTTKTLDNGINIDDPKVKNIVIMAWDKITFIQMLGRCRVDIEKAYEINLYICLRNIKSFYTWRKVHNDKLDEIRLCKEKPNEFCRKYDNDLDKLGELNDLFYRNKETGDWEVNPLGEKRVQADIEFVEYMIEKFREEGRFAYINEQLSWIGLKDTFDENNLIEDVIPNEERISLEEYLDRLYNTNPVMLENNDRQELIEMVNVRDGNNQNRLLKGISTINGRLEEIEVSV